jgi:hypothetical protein
LRFVGALLFLGAASTDAFAGCDNARVLYPVASAIVADARPAIAWTPVSGAKRYRILLRSQVPNGPVIQEIDNWVSETQFAPPRALAVERAHVTVRVVPDCADDVATARLTGSEHRFAIDMTAACAPPSDLKFAADALAWTPSAGARSYEVAVFAVSSPKELLRAESATTSHPLRAQYTPGSVAAVRAKCARGLSNPTFTLLR